MLLKIKKLNADAVLPKYAHPSDAGMDLFSSESISLLPKQSKMIKTGIAIQVPKNTEAQIRPRSGLALKHQLTVLNSPGTIDEGYRGEICVILINHGNNIFLVDKGMKIAQMVIKPLLQIEIEETDDLSDSERGSAGFGSTGN